MEALPPVAAQPFEHPRRPKRDPNAPLTSHAQRMHSDPLYAESVRAYHRDYSARRRKELLDHMGGCCVKCGYSDYRALHVDHVNGDGHEQRRDGRRNIALRPDRFKLFSDGATQLLCASCNVRKKITRGEFNLARPRGPRKAPKTVTPEEKVTCPLQGPPHHDSPSSKDQKPAIVLCVSS